MTLEQVRQELLDTSLWDTVDVEYYGGEWYGVTVRRGASVVAQMFKGLGRWAELLGRNNNQGIQ